MTITLDTTSLYSGKGFDVQNMVKQILDSRRGQETQWKNQQSALQQQEAAVDHLQSLVATLYTDGNNLRDFTGTFGTKTASSSEPGLVYATASSTAATANHQLRVENLETTATAYSAAIASEASLSAGSLSITVGETTKTVPIAADSSFSQIAGQINDLKFGVTAKVQTDSSGSRLILVSDNAGAAGDFSVEASGPLSFTQQPGRNAVVNVDGVPFSSSTNIVTGAIPGVTLHLASAAPDTDVTLNVSPDMSSVAESISTFVTDFNAVICAINSQFTYDPSSKTAGVLSGDSSLRLVQNSLLSMASFSMKNNGTVTSLQSLGILMGDDGTLSINRSTLNAALTDNFSDLANFFQGSESFGTRLGTTLTALNSPSTSPLSLDVSTLRKTDQELTNQINDFEDRLAAQQQTLLQQYSAINAQLQSLPSLQSQVSAALDSLTGTYGKSQS